MGSIAINANVAQPYKKYDKFFIFLYYTIKLIKCYDNSNNGEYYERTRDTC